MANLPDRARGRGTTQGWAPGWAKVVAGMATLFPLGLAGTGLVTMTTAVGQMALTWMWIGVGTTLGAAAIAAPLGVFLLRGGKGWFAAGLGLVAGLAIALTWLALQGT